jgi:hypothetical protein
MVMQHTGCTRKGIIWLNHLPQWDLQVCPWNRGQKAHNFTRRSRREVLGVAIAVVYMVFKCMAI